MSVLLFAITAATVGVIGVTAYFVSDDGGVLYQLWSSLMYTLDAAEISGENYGHMKSWRLSA